MEELGVDPVVEQGEPGRVAHFVAVDGAPEVGEEFFEAEAEAFCLAATTAAVLQQCRERVEEVDSLGLQRCEGGDAEADDAAGEFEDSGGATLEGCQEVSVLGGGFDGPVGQLSGHSCEKEVGVRRPNGGGLWAGFKGEAGVTGRGLRDLVEETAGAEEGIVVPEGGEVVGDLGEDFDGEVEEVHGGDC